MVGSCEGSSGSKLTEMVIRSNCDEAKRTSTERIGINKDLNIQSEDRLKLDQLQPNT